VTLLPDREMATVEAWLAGHPDIRVLSRDRGVAPIVARIGRIDFRTAPKNAALAFSIRCQRSATWMARGNAFEDDQPGTADLRGPTAIRRLPAAPSRPLADHSLRTAEAI
jgi:hypothetical protein